MGWTVYNSSGQILQGSSTLADESVDSDHYVDASIDNAHLADNAVDTEEIANDAVTYAKMQNLATADRVLGSTSTGVIGEVQIVPDMLATDAVTNVKVATGIDAVKLADGSVTNAELQYINSLSSNAQTQIAAKQATIDSSARLNANLIHDGSVTNTEFGYINTLSSNAQTQLAAKHGSITSSARLNANLIGANGNVSNTEYGYLSGVTSDIQTQLAAGGGSITREGSSTAEVTSTSTDDADINTVSGLSIGVLEPFESISCLRRTGQSGRTRVGYKVNSIDTHSPGSWQHADVSATLNALRWIRVAPRVTNYFRCGLAFAIPDGGNHIHGTGFDNAGRAAEFPNATITSVTILVASNTSNITQGGDELHVYSMSVS